MGKSAVQSKFSVDQSTTLLLVVGCCAPIGATVLDLLRHGLPFSLSSILAVQTTQPLHWFIDSIPFLVFFLQYALTHTTRGSAASSRSHTPGEGGNMSTTKLTQAVTDLKAELAKQRRVEETLRASEEFYHTLVENTNDGIATISLDGTLTSVNRGFEIMLGKIREEIVGKPYSTILSGASLALIEDRMRRFQAGEKLPSLFAFDLLHHNGTPVHIEARVRPINDKNGSPIGFQGVYRDTAKRTSATHATVTTQTTPTKSEVPPWVPSATQAVTNTPAHYPPGYSPLSQRAPSSPAVTSQGVTENHNPVSSAPQAASTVSLAAALPSVSSSLSTSDGQPIAPPVPQFRFADTTSEVSARLSLSSSPSERAEAAADPSQFTIATSVLPGPIGTVPPQLGSASSQQMMNLDEALDRVEGDRELLCEMAGVFLDEYPLLLVTMQDALSHGNAQTLTYAVHTLKGSVANFAATNVFEACLKLEKIARQGNLVQAKTALAELEAELARLAPLLTTLKMEAAA
jgi:PAS domain S-box-containing protein